MSVDKRYPHDDNIYRVVFQDRAIYRAILPDWDSDLQYVTVRCIGMRCKDGVSGHYAVGDLPTWMRDKLAVLSIMSTDPPCPVIESVGRRIYENTFWVFAD
jgi:hypothetical protein